MEKIIDENQNFNISSIVMEDANFSELKHILMVIERDKELRERQREELSKVCDYNFRSKKKTNEICPVCKNKVDLEDLVNSVTCKGCANIICRKAPCANWISKLNEWECELCSRNRHMHHGAGEWLLKQLNQRFHVTTTINNDDILLENNNTNNLYNNSISLYQRDKVRQFLEDLLASMLDTNNLDQVPVGQIYKNTNYLPIYDHECPGISHVELKRLVQKIIVEVVKLPDLFNFSVPVRPDEILPYFDPKRYQELLATAVLNKIVQSYKNPLNLPSPDINISDKLNNENDLEKEKKQFDLFNSIEPQSVSSHCESLTEQPMSITIEERIEEFSPIESQENSGSFSSSMSENDETNLTDYLHKHQVPLPDITNESDTNDDDIQSLKSNGTDGTWEDNWLFRSRKFKTEPSNSIGMLVPSPTEEVKTLIGDKNADEVSDLSEAGSDNEYGLSDNDDDNTGDIPNDLLQNKRIIGGKHNLDSFESPKIIMEIPLVETILPCLDTVDNITPIIKEIVEIPVEEKMLKFERPLNDIQFDTLQKRDKTMKIVDIENEALNSVIIEKENNLLENSVNSDKIHENGNNSIEYENISNKVINSMKPPVPAPRSSDNPPKPGSIAEREHLKWENAAPMENNPYSAEVLQRRLTQRPPTNCIDLRNIPKIPQVEEIPEEPIEKLESTTEKTEDIFKPEQPSFRRFGRDYYINEAKKASGERKRRSEIHIQQSLLEEQEFDEKPIQRSRSFTEDQLTENIFAARPIRVNQDDPILEKATKIESLSTDERDFYLLPIDSALSLTSSESSIISPLHFESLSEDSDSTRIYDLKTREKKIVKQIIPNTDYTETNIELKLDETSSESNSVEIITPKINKNKLIIPGINSKDTVKFFENKNNQLNCKKMDEEQLFIDSTIIVKSKVAEMETEPHENGINEHPVIEEELINALPSVKLLANIFSVNKDAEQSSLPIQRPKTVPWHSSKEANLNDCTECPIESSPNSFQPQYTQNYHPVSPGYSITGRSISKQIREELKDVGNDNDNDNQQQQRPVTPERSPSPVPIKGQLKNSIAFFENLKNKK